MGNYTTHVLYSEFGADISAVGTCYDPLTKIKVTVGLKLQWNPDVPHHLDNSTRAIVFVHRPGQPPELLPDDTVFENYKGEDLSCCVEESGLSMAISGHSTKPEDQHPDGSRKTVIEAVTIPNVFVKA